MSVNRYGTMAIAAAIGRLDRTFLAPAEKLYLLGMADSDNPQYLQDFTCLCDEAAEVIRVGLSERGFIGVDGVLDLAYVQSLVAS